MTDDDAVSAFEDETLSDFEFLVRLHGFHVAEREPRRIRYESQAVFIGVFYGAYDYEVGIQFGHIGETAKYDFSFYLRRFHPDIDEALGDRLADTASKVRKVVKALATALKEHGQPIIGNDPDIYAEVAKIRWWHFKPEALGYKES
jgi:hypothetical protein